MPEFAYVIHERFSSNLGPMGDKPDAIIALAAEGMDAQDAREAVNDLKPGEQIEYGSTTILCTWPAD